MNIYDFDGATGEYLGARAARQDPKETEAQGQAVYLIPANATTVAPPAEVGGKARVWDGSAWGQEDDLRGTRYWTAADGLQTMAALGPLPAGATTVPGADPQLWLVGGVWTDQQPIPSRAEMKARLDAGLEAKMNTIAASEPGAWKAMILTTRLEEADAALLVVEASIVPSDYPALQALLGSSYGSTIHQVANAVKAERAGMLSAIAAIDQAVVLGKDAVDAAANDAAAFAEFETALEAIS